MFKKLLLAAAFALLATSAVAQNVQCPNRPLGDSTNACANTRFVIDNAGGGGGTPGGSTTQLQYNNAGAFGGITNVTTDGSQIALGTPLSGIATNITGLPVGTGISGLGAGIASWLATPSSANLATAVTGETGSGALVFGTSPTVSAPTISGTTNLTGGQIQFPAVQVPSAGANTLDDYEEGSWTPVLTFSIPGNLSITYTAQVGTYIKIGRVVNLFGRIDSATFTHTTASGSVRITGLPFTAATISGMFWNGNFAGQGITKASYTDFSMRVGSGGNFAEGVAMGSGQPYATINAADMPSGGGLILIFGITYFADN